MNYRAIALATIIGISTPAIIDVAMNQTALAARYNYPQGTFVGDGWRVTLSYDNNVYYYYGENQNTKAYITLSGAVASGNNVRQVYTWNNNRTKYQITWRPADPNFIRVQVRNPNGKEALNCILKKVNN